MVSKDSTRGWRTLIRIFDIPKILAVAGILLQGIRVARWLNAPKPFFEIVDLSVQQYEFISPLIVVPGKYCTEMFDWVFGFSVDSDLVGPTW